MPTVKVRDLNNKEVGEIELAESVFGVPFNEALVHAAVKNYLANGRQGTASTKTRGEVSGSGRKLWKQKGTGRARIASIRSPLWRGGGTVHGPKPRDWSYAIPKKMRRGAIRAAISERMREGNIMVIDSLNLPTHKTGAFSGVLQALGLRAEKSATKALIVDSLDNRNLVLSSRMIDGVKVTNSLGVNIYDVVYHEKLVLTKQAVEDLVNLLDPATEKRNAGGAA